MNSIDELIQDAFDDLTASARHDDELAGTIRRRSRYRRAAAAAPIAAAVAVVAVVGTIVALRPAGVQVGYRVETACSPIQTAVLPTWARAGFSDAQPTAPFVASKSGELLAIIFASPLVSPALPDLGNKILWVTSDDASAGDTLHISGKLEGGTAKMQATVEGGPGPSLINVPVAGCWLFDVSWGTHRDTIDIPYGTG